MFTVKIKTNENDANQKTDNSVTNTNLFGRSNNNINNNQQNSAMNNVQDDPSNLIINSENTKIDSNKPTNEKYKTHLTDAKMSNVSNNETSLSRTITRNSCASINAQNIAKSWYARCNRWRSQSCDRRKCSTIVRYSWNTVNNRPA